MSTQVMTADITFEQIFNLVERLRPVEQVRLISQLASKMEGLLAKVESTPPTATPRKPLYGLLSDLGPAPSAEDIDEARREMWASFD